MKEGVEVERDVSKEERGASVGVRRHTLEKRQSVAHPVRLVGRQSRRVDSRINVDNFLNTLIN